MKGQIFTTLIGAMLALTGAWTLIQAPEAAEPMPEASYSTASSSTLFTQLDHELSAVDGDDVRDIALRGDFAYVSGHSGFYIFNVSDPLAPVELGYLFCPARDVDVSGDVAALVGEGNSGECGANDGIHLIDISDATNPVYVQTFAHTDHTVTAYGESGIFHSSTQNLYKFLECCPAAVAGVPPEVYTHDSSGFQDIIVAPDAYNAHIERYYFPQFAANGDVVQSAGCHDIKFDLALERGYCAAVDETQIWDMTDPLNPIVLSVIKNPSISIHHSAVGDDAGDLLIINDEMGGALVSGCVPNSEGLNPNGALWFYDISDVSSPEFISYVSLPAGDDPAHMRCTSHFGEILPNQQQAIWPWYVGGPVLVDFQDVTQPKIIQSYEVPGADTWSAYLHNGYVFTGDTNRGFEVFSIS